MKIGELKISEKQLNEMTVRVEELEMMQSTNSLETKDIHRRYKVQISQLKSEYETL